MQWPNGSGKSIHRTHRWLPGYRRRGKGCHRAREGGGEGGGVVEGGLWEREEVERSPRRVWRWRERPPVGGVVEEAAELWILGLLGVEGFNCLQLYK